MINKILRDEKTKTYNLKITDKNNNSFFMLVGGNCDLYWVPEDYKKCLEFVIDKNDELVFEVFSLLFKEIEKKDDHYDPLLKDNIFTFISEEWIKEESNILQITKEEESFKIKFIKNENYSSMSIIHRGCPICFCNSGSRVPRIEALFMRVFNYLAYECDEVKEILKR